MKLTPKLAGISAALLLISSSASAVVTTWEYSVSSLFTFSTYSDNSTSSTPTNKLSWGSGSSGPSSLTIDGSPTTGAISTYEGKTPPQTAPYLGLGISLTHDNNPVSGKSLTSATLSNVVALDPSSPNNPALSPFNFLFSIAFTETTNSLPCDVLSPTPCNDIFVLTSGLMNSSFDYDDGTGLSTYYLNLFPTSGGVLSTLTDEGCAAAGAAKGCIGFTTAEGHSTTLSFGFTISTEKLEQPPGEVPEPGILALLGLGLLGIFGYRRRQS